METRLKGHKSLEIERDFFNKPGVPIDGDPKSGALPPAPARLLGGDTGNPHRNDFL